MQPFVISLFEVVPPVDCTPESMDVTTATEENTTTKAIQEKQTQKKKKGKKRRRKMIPMPKEIEEDEELHKYWFQRYRLFSRYDEGVRMDRGENSVDFVLKCSPIMKKLCFQEG